MRLLTEHPLVQHVRGRRPPARRVPADPGPLDELEIVSAGEFTAAGSTLLAVHVASRLGIAWGLWRRAGDAWVFVSGMHPTEVHHLSAVQPSGRQGRPWTEAEYRTLLGDLDLGDARWTVPVGVRRRGVFWGTDT